jgi:hypothetical protein
MGIFRKNLLVRGRKWCQQVIVKRGTCPSDQNNHILEDCNLNSLNNKRKVLNSRFSFIREGNWNWIELSCIAFETGFDKVFLVFRFVNLLRADDFNLWYPTGFILFCFSLTFLTEVWRKVWMWLLNSGLRYAHSDMVFQCWTASNVVSEYLTEFYMFYRYLTEYANDQKESDTRIQRYKPFVTVRWILGSFYSFV